MIKVNIKKLAGSFAENKDIAREIRVNKIMPAIKKGQKITLDFNEVSGATQSFIHALISDAIRKYGNIALDSILFKNCNPIIKELVTIVTEYMQES